MRCAVCGEVFKPDDAIDWDHTVPREKTAQKQFRGESQETRQREAAKHRVSYLVSRPAGGRATCESMVLEAAREILGLTKWGGCRPVHREGCHVRGRS